MGQKIQRYGWRHDSLDRRDKVFQRTLPWLTPLPASVDWSQKLPPCYDQGNLGSCTANAIAAALQFLQGTEGEPLVMPSRLFIYYNERAMEGSVAGDSGAEIRDGIKSVNAQGDCPESEWPYVDDGKTFAVLPPNKCYADASKELLLQYLSVDNTILVDLLAALAQGPVVGGFTVFESFQSDAVAASGVVPMPGPDEAQVGGHAVLWTGYDQTAGIIRGRNSWGPGWGNNGYFTIPMQYLTDPTLADDFWLCERIT
jgi:C1A family cysteine protease